MPIREILFFLVFAFTLLFSSCEHQSQKSGISSYFEKNAGPDLQSKVEYAEGFEIFEWNGITKLVIYHPELRELVIGEYYITDKDTAMQFSNSAKLFVAPADSVAVFSATQLSAFDKLGLIDRVVGVSEAEYIINEKVQQKIKNGEVTELAGSGNFFIERTITTDPSLIFYSPYKVTESHALDVTGIPLIPFFDYFETDPLGRAEWIKFTAVFFGKREIADSLFNNIVTEYKALKVLAESLSNHPTILSDKYFNGQWYVPGGQSYIARLFADAGTDYLWSDDPHSASFPLDYEVVFGRAYNADYWRIVGSYGDDPTYEGLLAENGLYQHFDAFKNQRIIYCNARETAYFENSPLEPQLILADLIKAVHPKLLPDYSPKYYKMLP